VAPRYVELDRLRVMVVLCVFLFHTARFFDPMDWHVKNATTHPLLLPPMMFFAAWAMPLLFVVSGAGARFAVRRRGPAGFARDRTLRLLVPLAAGVPTHVMWQVYLERLGHGQFRGSFLAFVPHYFEGLYGYGGDFAWMGLHLWFLELLLLYSLVFLPALSWLGRGGGARVAARVGDWLAPGGRVYLLALPVLLALVVPAPGRLWSDRTFGAFNLLAHACFFASGFLLVSSDRLYQSVRRLRRASAAVAAIGGALVGAAWPRSGELEHGTLLAAAVLSGFALVSWAAVLAFLGFGIQGRGSPPTPLLARANEAVLPIYVLHQSVIVGLGYAVVRQPIPDLAKWALIAAGSAIACLAIYELLVRRSRVLRFLFGMRPRA
jgi:peptidoglycan/LPS O-acetylase OafA/YrhL